MTTPIERAQDHLDQVVAEVQRLTSEQHDLEARRTTARQAGNNPEHERVSGLFRENDLALKLATNGALPDARQQLAQAQQDLRRARDRAGETSRAAQRLDREVDELQQRLASLQVERERAQQAAQAAQAELTTLEPPTPARAVLAAPDEPVHVIEVEPHPPRAYPAPARILSQIGAPTEYRDAAGQPVDQNGAPLAVQPEPAASTQRRKRGDQNDQVQTAPSLFD